MTREEKELMDALAEAIAYNGIPQELPFLRVVATGVIRDLAIAGWTIERRKPK